MKQESKEELETLIKKLKKERILLIIVLIVCIALPNTLLCLHIHAESEYEEFEERTGNYYILQEKEMYNATVKKYIGDSKKGSEVKLMIEDIISNNNQNVNEQGKFISVHNGRKGKKIYGEGYATDTSKRVEAYTGNLDDVCKIANKYENAFGHNNQENIDAATEEMRAFSKKISSGKKYSIQEAEEDGIIFAVFVAPIH